jgi:putative nucleotidyltransferase with HDIG domain
VSNKEKVLIIDDELAPRESIRMVLKDQYDVLTAAGAHEGLDIMDKESIAIVVMDIKMPKMDGITALKEIKERHPETEVVLLTAYASLETARDAIRFGAFDYLLKPFDKDDMLLVINKGLKKRRNKENLKLERELLLNRTMDLENQIKKVRNNLIKHYDDTVKGLILTIDAKDHYTYNHSNRVAALSKSIAEALNVTGRTLKEIEDAAKIHDIGKIGIEKNILNKEGGLTSDEYEEVKKHPSIGVRIVQEIHFLEDAVPVIKHHHERYDGMGYPEGVRGDDIPLSARIVVVADAIDAMMSARPYRSALPMDKVRQELSDNAGTQFDPSIVNIIMEGKVALA